MIPALGFMPDADPTTPGVFVDCANIVPTIKGFAAGPSLSDPGYDTLPGECRGSGLIIRLDNTKRLFAATPTAIYENITSAWVDRSRAGGYDPGGENRWRFAQFGNVTLATNQLDPIQESVAGVFADIPTAPQARIIETVAGFVMAFATVDPLNGDEPDRWWSSGLYDHTAWTPSQATQAANGRLIDSPGEIRAAKKLGNDIVAYKEKSMYLGRYVGPPVIWTWQQIPGECGAISQESVVSIDTAHVFIGNDDFWLFDGSRPTPIGAPIRYWFFGHSSPQYRYRTIGYYDRFNALVYWYFVSKQSASGALDECLIYNTKTQKWGRATRSILATVEYVSSGLTYDTMGDKYPTFEDITGIAYDSPLWFSQGSGSAVVVPGGKLMLLDGEPGASSITLNDAGSDDMSSTITKVRPRFLKTPVSGALQAFYKDVAGDPLVAGESANLEAGKFDLLWSACWHRVQMNFMGEMEMNAFDITLVPDGSR